MSDLRRRRSMSIRKFSYSNYVQSVSLDVKKSG
jgi:hypothetical protein